MLVRNSEFLMKLRLPKRRAWRVAIYLGALVLVVLAIDLIVANARRRVRPGYTTTRIVEPRKPDGLIDYGLALDEYFARGVTPANNAAIPLLQVLGPAAVSTNHPETVYAGLDMPPLPEAGDYFVDYAAYMRVRSLPATNEPIKLELPREFTYAIQIAPEIAQWAKDNDAALTRFVEATRRPRFFIPLYGQQTLTLAEKQLRHAKYLKEAGHALHARAIRRLADGNADGFIEDVLALHRLARLMSQAGTMVERVVGMSIETSAGCDDVFAAHRGKLSAQQSHRLIAQLDALGDLPTSLDAIDRAERFMGMDVVQTLAKLPPTEAGRLFNGIQGREVLPPYTFRFLPIPYERTMIEMNRAYDGMLAAARQPTYPERVGALRLWIGDIDTGQGRGTIAKLFSADWAVALLLPSLETAETRLELARMQTRLAQVALALAAYEAERGAYPATLAELSPAHLRAVPVDSFVEKPLMYSPKGDGYGLRSVGPNMKDDGGSGDDLVVDTARAPATTTTKTSSSGPARS
jgi:hypothetical protein